MSGVHVGMGMGSPSGAGAGRVRGQTSMISPMDGTPGMGARRENRVGVGMEGNENAPPGSGNV